MTLRSYRRPRQQSEKAKARGHALDLVRREVFKRDEWKCRIALSPDCTGEAEDLHHLRLRSQGGTDEPANLLSACRYCHNWTHSHPALAREAGVIV